MTVLFRKITNKMIWNCRQHINGTSGEKIWDQDIPQLITRLQSCARRAIGSTRHARLFSITCHATPARRRRPHSSAHTLAAGRDLSPH